MSAARRKGTAAETAVARYLAEAFHDDRIERRARTGSNDRGDIAGVRFNGERIVIEVKNCKRIELAQWVKEAQVEAGNDDALLGLVVHKKKGTTNPGEWYVTTTLADLVQLMGGEA